MNKNKGKRKGVLPSYWINLDELAQVFLDLLGKKTYIDYGKQKVDGIILDVIQDVSKQEIIWNVTEDLIALTGIEFLPNDCRNIGYLNSFDMYIDDELYFENIYIKEVEEYKHFNIRKPLKKGSTIKFIFNNNDNMLEYLMFNIHYIGNIKIKKYNIICKDIDTNSIIQQKELFLVQPFDEQHICPIDIEGYVKLSEECIVIKNEDINDEIIFYYQKEELAILHNYDILCKLYWNGNVDLDFHCLISGQQEVLFNNKEIGIDDKNKCWLDYDYRTGGNNPEIITILGFKNDKALLKVNHYAGNLYDNEEIKIEIYKKSQDKMDILLREFSIIGANLSHKTPVNVCEIDLKTQKVIKLI